MLATFHCTSRNDAVDRLHCMEVFAAVADAGSFARAARRLHLSPAAATRAVAALEDRLGVRLLNRTTRSLGLTEPGLGYLAACGARWPSSRRPSAWRPVRPGRRRGICGSPPR